MRDTVRLRPLPTIPSGRVAGRMYDVALVYGEASFLGWGRARGVTGAFGARGGQANAAVSVRLVATVLMIIIRPLGSVWKRCRSLRQDISSSTAGWVATEC